MDILRRLRTLEPAEAVILLADLAINLGFYMLIPFISVHVRNNLGLTATIAGTVLAVRTGVQQVLMVLAGPLADLYGYKRVLLAGLLIRAAGFSSFALMGNLAGLLVSAVLSGTGGALFSASERAAYAALRPGADQSSRFALLYTAQNTGITIGPLVGSLLLHVNFRFLSVVAGFVYLPIAALVYFFLPNLASGRPSPAPTMALAEVVTSILTVAHHRAFVAYCLISAGFWAIAGQINISLSLQAATVTGSLTAVKNLLLVSSLMVIVLQYQLTRWVEGKWPPLVLWAFGSALSGVAFLALIPFPGMAGLLTCVILLTLGGMLLRPVDYQMVVGMGPQDSVASYYGFSAISVALGGSAGQYLGGRLIDVADATGQASLPWLVFAAFGLGAALLMRWFDRSVHPVPTA